ncbi:nuclease [Aquincola sp. S2]|uniref:phospholipase D n=1 Tax=Pseudaquabacterium terrae TaxID=2732868 RepID=A0ABX2EKP4_9BURK|nr:phospholipase D-like domain-containing protein [Aquabacterium terrae]NRF69166.1 nuclease [Aquabacterium terrae]
MTDAANTTAALLDQLQRTLDDDVLSDDEKRSLSQALREAEPPEDALRQLRNRAFALVRERAAESPSPPLALLRWLEGVVRCLDNARAPVAEVQAHAAFSPGEHCLSMIRGQLRSAKRRADLCVFTLSDDRISAEVLAMHRRGIAVRLITDGAKAFDAGSDVHALRAAGVPVALDTSDAHMHHKFAIIDQAWLLNGSYNWTRSACEHNEENVVLCNHPALVAQFGVVFERLWRALA